MVGLEFDTVAPEIVTVAPEINAAVTVALEINMACC